MQILKEKSSEILELKRNVLTRSKTKKQKNPIKQTNEKLSDTAFKISFKTFLEKNLSYLEVHLEKCCAADMAKSIWVKKGKPHSSLRDLTNQHFLIYSKHKNNLIRDWGKPIYFCNCLKEYTIMIWLFYWFEN